MKFRIKRWQKASFNPTTEEGEANEEKTRSGLVTRVFKNIHSSVRVTRCGGHIFSGNFGSRRGNPRQWGGLPESICPPQPAPATRNIGNVLQIVCAKSMRFKRVRTGIAAQMRPGGRDLRTDIERNPVRKPIRGRFREWQLRR